MTANSMNIFVAIAALQWGNPHATQALENTQACQIELHDCMLNGCDGVSVAAACPFDGFADRSLSIVRTEVTNAHERIESDSQRIACQSQMQSFWQASVSRLNQTGLTLGYRRSPLSKEASLSSVELETVIRSELDIAMSNELARIHNDESWECVIPPWTPLAMLRGQNVAFTETHQVLDRLEDSSVAASWALSNVMIYLHADLWQPEQVAALERLENEVHRGSLNDANLAALRTRIANQRPFYDGVALEQDWPAPDQ